MRKNLYSYGLFILLIFSLASACTTHHKNRRTVLTGKVLHPSKKFMLLYSTYLAGKQADTAFIDSSGNFVFNLSPDKAKLYAIANGDDMGYVFIAPGDSVDLFMDMRNLDATLAFSGDNRDFNELQKNLYLMDAANQSNFLHMLIKSDLKYENLRFFLKRINEKKEEILANEGEKLRQYMKDSAKKSVIYVMTNVFPLFVKEVFKSYHSKDKSVQRLDSITFNWKKEYPAYVILPMFASFYFTDHYLPNRTFSPDSIAYLFGKINQRVVDKDLADMTKVFVIFNMFWKNLGKNRVDKLNKIYVAIQNSFFSPQYLQFAIDAFTEMSQAVPGGMFQTKSLWNLKGRHFSPDDWKQVKGNKLVFVIDTLSLQKGVYDSIFENPKLLEKSYFIHLQQPSKSFLFFLLTNKNLADFKNRNYIYRREKYSRFVPFKLGYLYIVDNKGKILKLFPYEEGHVISTGHLENYLDSLGGK